jgi:hypothetical protein
VTPSEKEDNRTGFGDPASGASYSVHYQFSLGAPMRAVKAVTLKELLNRYVDHLWEAGSEPPRLYRRPFGLSYAAMAGASSMA